MVRWGLSPCSSEGKAKFQLEVSEKEDLIFPQVHKPPKFYKLRNPLYQKKIFFNLKQLYFK